MNIIANLCHGAELYKKMNIQFENPFIWNVITFDSILYLMQNFQNINFNDISLEKSNRYKNTFNIIIEGKVKLEFIHHYFCEKYSEPTKIGSNLYYNKMWEYVYNKYTERTKRMLVLKEKPIFLIMDNRDDFTFENTQKLLDNTNYPLILFTHRDYKISNNLISIIKTKQNPLKIEPADFIKYHYNDIKIILDTYSPNHQS